MGSHSQANTTVSDSRVAATDSAVVYRTGSDSKVNAGALSGVTAGGDLAINLMDGGAIDLAKTTMSEALAGVIGLAKQTQAAANAQQDTASAALQSAVTASQDAQTGNLLTMGKYFLVGLVLLGAIYFWKKGR